MQTTTCFKPLLTAILLALSCAGVSADAVMPVAADTTSASAKLSPEATAAGAAYQAYLKTVKTGNVDAIIALATPQNAAQLQSQRNSKDFPMMMGLFQAMHPSEVTLLGGHQGRRQAHAAGKQHAGRAEDAR